MTKHQSITVFNNLGIADELSDPEFRNQFFRSELEIDIPAQIKFLRKLRGLNQSQLAHRIGTKQSGISRFEKGQAANWTLETLIKFAEALDARISVTIEPYEAVIARYRQEETFEKRETTRLNQPRSRQYSEQAQLLPRDTIPKTQIQSDYDGLSNNRTKQGHISNSIGQAYWSTLSTRSSI